MCEHEIKFPLALADGPHLESYPVQYSSIQFNTIEFRVLTVQHTTSQYYSLSVNWGWLKTLLEKSLVRVHICSS